MEEFILKPNNQMGNVACSQVAGKATIRKTWSDGTVIGDGNEHKEGNNKIISKYKVSYVKDLLTQNWNKCVLLNEHIDTSYWRDTEKKIDYYFDKYLPDGRMQYCELRSSDKGWDSNDLNDNHWRKLQNYCKMHKLYMPKIRKFAKVYEPPRIFAGESQMILDKKSVDSNALGNYMANISKIQVPSGWSVRAFSGKQFNGISEDYEPGIHQLRDPLFTRSLHVSLNRPAILSRKDNHLGQRWIAILMDDIYKVGDLNDGIFLHLENNKKISTQYKTGIDKVWVPVGYQVTLFDGEKSQVIYGHNTNGWMTPNFVVRSIEVRIILPITFSKRFYSGVVGTLQAGDNPQVASRPVTSLIIPTPGYTVIGKTPNGNTTLPQKSNLDQSYAILELRVSYNTRNRSNFIENVPVRTKDFMSKRNFAADCQKECSSNNDCNAYYAIRIMSECPNPKADNGENNGEGCKAKCGFYENQGSNIAKVGKFKNIEPYIFKGNVHVKSIWDAN